jgi:hypothetical protein
MIYFTKMSVPISFELLGFMYLGESPHSDKTAFNKQQIVHTKYMIASLLNLAAYVWDLKGVPENIK